MGDSSGQFLFFQVVSLVRNSPALSTLASITVLKPVFYVLQQTNHWMFMGYSLVSFCLFTWDKWLKVHKSFEMTPFFSPSPHCILT